MEPHSHGSGSGTETVYVVEARSTYTQPQLVNGMMLDSRWHQVSVSESPVGVPNRVFTAEASKYNCFLSHSAALALAHVFLANADRGFCVETRLVKIEIFSSYSTKETGVSAPLSHFGTDMTFTEREV